MLLGQGATLTLLHQFARILVGAEDDRLDLGSRLERIRHRFGKLVVVRTLAADRVGVGRIAREHVRLAAAAAEVVLFLVAGLAQIVHPAVAAVLVEGRRVVPDPLHALVTGVREFDAGQHAGHMAGQHGAVCLHGDEHIAPAIHALLRALGVIVRHDEEELHLALHLLAEGVGDLLGTDQLLLGRQQLIAVEEGPAVELAVGQLDVIGLHALGHLENLADVVDVELVQHTIEHHRVVVFLDQGSDARLELEGLGAGEEIVHLLGRVLEAELNVVEAGFLERLDAGLGHADAAGDQVDVVTELVRLGDDLLEVVAQQRLATREAQLCGAHGTALAQHADPFLGRELVVLLGVVDRVVAEHAVQRAAVGDLRQQPQRRVDALAVHRIAGFNRLDGGSIPVHVPPP